MEIRLIKEGKITMSEVRQMAEAIFGDMVKATADIKREKMAIGGEMHIDSNELLLRDGSEQADVWGFNIYPEGEDSYTLEYNSLVNIKPLHGNRSPDIKDETVKDKIKLIAAKFIAGNIK